MGGCARVWAVGICDFMALGFAFGDFGLRVLGVCKSTAA